MSARNLKNVSAPEAPNTPLPSPSLQRLGSAELRDLTSRADPTQPPAVMPVERASTLITLRVQTSLANQIADAAEKQGTTQKVILTRGLAATGFQVSPMDLEDRTPRRRRR